MPHVYNIYTYADVQPHGSRQAKSITQANTNNTNGLILFPSLADHDESLLVENRYGHICIHVQNGSLQLLALDHLSSSCPWIPQSPHCFVHRHKNQWVSLAAAPDLRPYQ